jgi:hypothetical protein
MELEIASRLQNLEKRMEIIEDPDQQQLFKDLVAQVTGTIYANIYIDFHER